MNLLVTNDDGWDAPGLKTLAQVAQKFGNVWIVAPENPMSGISHQMTFEVPMRFAQRDHQSYSLAGTPADCVRVALSKLDVPFDWVLSGINQGANLGIDVYISGTVAAAREATYFGRRSIAMSQYLNGFRDNFDWTLARELADRLLPELFESDLKPGEYINVNFPDTLGEPVTDVSTVYTKINRHPLPTAYQDLSHEQILYNGKYQDRILDAESDASVCFGGKVSVTRHFPSG